MTTNESSFFRDRAVFEQFRDTILPALLAQRAETKRLRIWCAACAAGQEAYSIAMLLDDHKLAAQGWTIDLIATDLSSEIDRARRRGRLLPSSRCSAACRSRRLVDHFTQEGANWRVDEIAAPHGDVPRLQPSGFLRLAGRLDVVFCRNVLMYFDHKNKAAGARQDRRDAGARRRI